MEEQEKPQESLTKYEIFKRYFPYVVLVALALQYLRKDAQYNELQQSQTIFWRDAFVRINDAYNNRQRSYDYREDSRSYYPDSNLSQGR
jgi:hypothetical protein